MCVRVSSPADGSPGVIRGRGHAARPQILCAGEAVSSDKEITDLNRRCFEFLHTDERASSRAGTLTRGSLHAFSARHRTTRGAVMERLACRERVLTNFVSLY